MFCYLVPSLIGMLVWGAWHLQAHVFVSFESRSKLFTGDVLEVSQVLHCSSWAVRGTSEHRQLSGKNVMNTVVRGCYFLVTVISNSLMC